MSEESKKTDGMSWDEHFREGMEGLKGELRDTIQSRETIGNVRKHSRAAMKEMLLAWRSLLDGAIERIDAAEKTGTQHATKIKIE